MLLIGDWSYILINVNSKFLFSGYISNIGKGCYGYNGGEIWEIIYCFVNKKNIYRLVKVYYNKDKNGFDSIFNRRS